eukprot:m.5123 g.5123  ORF g.5123 m.5123 type:complete len:191 (+) comp12155_c0_seq2:36-608(+)
MAFVFLFANYMSWLGAVVVLLLSLLAALVYRLFNTWRHSKLLEKQFGGPPRHWLYGSLEHMASTDAKLRRTGEEFTVKYPLAYLLWVGPFDARIVATHPDSMKAVAGSEPKGPLYRVLEGIAGVGLVLAEGAVWRRRRHLITPAFHSNILKPYVKIYNDLCHRTLVTKTLNHAQPTLLVFLAGRASGYKC